MKLLLFRKIYKTEVECVFATSLPSTVTLEDDLGKFEIKREEAAKVLRPTFGLTYASTGGMTIPGRLRLHDADHPRFDWRNLFVGLSWETAADDVEVVGVWDSR